MKIGMRIALVLMAFNPVWLVGCGGGSSSSPEQEVSDNMFDGGWKSKSCTSDSSNSFFINRMDIKGESVTAMADAYTEINCDGVGAIPVTITASFKYGSSDVPAEECKDGKATEVDVALVSVSGIVSGQTITIRGDENIRSFLKSQGLDRVLPAYNLICLSPTGQELLSGDISGEKDGSTADLRPNSMDTINTLIAI